MRAAVLLVIGDAAVRLDLAAALGRAGFVSRAAATTRTALGRVLGTAEHSFTVTVMEDQVLRKGIAEWREALRVAPWLYDVPMVIWARTASHPEANRVARAYEVVAAGRGVAAVVEAVARAAGPPVPPGGIARGTERVGALAPHGDLHAYAHAKLVQYLGEARGNSVLDEITANMPGGRIVTTADLLSAAQHLRKLGPLEATVATLLAGRATLLHSDRTLRK